MRRTAAVVSIVSLTALVGCSSTPVYNAHPLATNTGAYEGAGDSLGMALFAEDIVVAKHGDKNSGFQNNGQPREVFASAPEEQD